MDPNPGIAPRDGIGGPSAPITSRPPRRGADPGFEIVGSGTGAIQRCLMRRNNGGKVMRAGREVLADHKTGFRMDIAGVKPRHAHFEIEVTGIGPVGVSEPIGVVPHITSACHYLQIAGSDRGRTLFNRVGRRANVAVVGEPAPQRKNASFEKGITHLGISKWIVDRQARSDADVKD